MILTCPDCATRYFVGDHAVEGGRMVRCTACGVAWRAEAAPELELTTTALDAAPSERPADPHPSELAGEELPKVFRARAQDQKRIREAATAGAVWTGMGAAFALLVVGAIVFRIDVVRIFPRAASAYAGVGLPVNAVGLTPEKVRAQRQLQNGHDALVVSGLVRNIRSRPVSPPPVVVRLLDKGGKRVAVMTTHAGDLPIAPGATRPFTVALLDPPMNASDVEVTFATASTSPAAPRHGALPAPTPARLRLRPATPDAAPTLTATEARAVSSGPFALTSAAAAGTGSPAQPAR